LSARRRLLKKERSKNAIANDNLTFNPNLKVKKENKTKIAKILGEKGRVIENQR